MGAVISTYLSFPPHSLLLFHCGVHPNLQLFTTDPNTDPSYGLQFFSNYCNMGLYHGELSFKNRVLQNGSLAAWPPLQITAWRTAPCSTYGLQGMTCFFMGLSRAAKSFCSRPAPTPALLLHWPHYMQGNSSHISSILSLSQLLHFYPFLDLLTERNHQCDWWARLFSVMGLFWNLRVVQYGDSSWPLLTPCYQNLST